MQCTSTHCPCCKSFGNVANRRGTTAGDDHLTSNDFAAAVTDFVSIIYAMNLQYYPGKLTYEFIQCVLLGIEVKRASAKVLSLREKLARMHSA